MVGVSIESTLELFATKPALAVDMIMRAIAAGVPLAWVAADSVYGTSDVEMALRRAEKGYVLGVNCNHHFHSWHTENCISGTTEEIAGSIERVTMATPIRRRGHHRCTTA